MFLTKTERENLNLVDMNNRVGSHLNCFRFGVNESKEHILKKLEVFLELREREENVITEAKFKTGRADVFSITSGTAFEVLCSEKEKEALEKVYPVRIVLVKA